MVPSLDSLLQASAKPEDYLKKTEKTQKASEWRTALEAYKPEAGTAKGLSKIKEKATIACFSAYWCKDCVRHVPALVRTLQIAENKNLRLAMLDYDQNKKMAEEAGVKAIPTFIIFGAEGNENGRIIENPSPEFKSLEEELLSRLTPSK